MSSAACFDLLSLCGLVNRFTVLTRLILQLAKLVTCLLCDVDTLRYHAKDRCRVLQHKIFKLVVAIGTVNNMVGENTSELDVILDSTSNVGSSHQ